MQELPIAQAAQSLGISIDSVRRRISKGDLKARKVPSSHGEMYVVELPDDVKPVTPEESDRDGTQTIEALQKMVSILETELDARRREVQELHVLLQQAQAALPPGRGTPVSIPWWRRLLGRGKTK